MEKALVIYIQDPNIPIEPLNPQIPRTLGTLA